MFSDIVCVIVDIPTHSKKNWYNLFNNLCENGKPNLLKRDVFLGQD